MVMGHRLKKFFFVVVVRFTERKKLWYFKTPEKGKMKRKIRERVRSTGQGGIVPSAESGGGRKASTTKTKKWKIEKKNGKFKRGKRDKNRWRNDKGKM